LFCDAHEPDDVQTGVTQSPAGLQSEALRHAKQFPDASHLPFVHSVPDGFLSCAQAAFAQLGVVHSPFAMQGVILIVWPSELQVVSELPAHIFAPGMHLLQLLSDGLQPAAPQLV
jgi:hypothetical protein